MQSSVINELLYLCQLIFEKDTIGAISIAATHPFFQIQSAKTSCLDKARLNPLIMKGMHLYDKWIGIHWCGKRKVKDLGLFMPGGKEEVPFENQRYRRQWKYLNPPHNATPFLSLSQEKSR